MTEQEYREALHEINVKAENERRILARAFAFEHSQVFGRRLYQRPLRHDKG